MNPKLDQRKSFISRKITPKKFAVDFRAHLAETKPEKLFLLFCVNFIVK